MIPVLLLRPSALCPSSRSYSASELLTLDRLLPGRCCSHHCPWYLSRCSRGRVPLGLTLTGWRAGVWQGQQLRWRTEPEELCAVLPLHCAGLLLDAVYALAPGARPERCRRPIPPALPGCSATRPSAPPLTRCRRASADDILTGNLTKPLVLFGLLMEALVFGIFTCAMGCDQVRTAWAGPTPSPPATSNAYVWTRLFL